MSNFQTSEKNYQEYAQLASSAESLIYSDPRSSLTVFGTFGEQLTKEIMHLDDIVDWELNQKQRIEKLALNGFQVYKILQKQYHIQIELAETNVLLCLFTIGSKEEDIKVLVNALKEISKVYYKEGKRERKLQPFNFSKSVLRPRSAYQGKEVKVKLEESLGYISKEMIMIYPPGIPLIIPGEIITKEILKQLDIYRKKKVNIISKYTNCDFVSCVAEKDDEN